MSTFAKVFIGILFTSISVYALDSSSTCKCAEKDPIVGVWTLGEPAKVPNPPWESTSTFFFHADGGFVGSGDQQIGATDGTLQSTVIGVWRKIRKNEYEFKAEFLNSGAKHSKAISGFPATLLFRGIETGRLTMSPDGKKMTNHGSGGAIYDPQDIELKHILREFHPKDGGDVFYRILVWEDHGTFTLKK